MKGRASRGINCALLARRRQGPFVGICGFDVAGVDGVIIGVPFERLP